jgi:hypothetical protein
MNLPRLADKLRVLAVRKLCDIADTIVLATHVIRTFADTLARAFYTMAEQLSGTDPLRQ